MTHGKRERSDEPRDGNISAPLTPPAVKGGSVPDMPSRGRGGTTAEDIARPRDKEATNEGQRVVSGFTTTDNTGSQGGRARFGGNPRREESGTAAAEDSEVE